MRHILHVRDILVAVHVVHVRVEFTILMRVKIISKLGCFSRIFNAVNSPERL